MPLGCSTLRVARTGVRKCALYISAYHNPTTTSPDLENREINDNKPRSVDLLESMGITKKRGALLAISMAFSRELTGSNDDEPYVSLERRLPGQFDN